MRLILFVFITFLSANYTSAQDLIIKLNGSQIKCEIIEIKEEAVTYITTDSDSMESILKAEIKEIIKGHYEDEPMTDNTSDIIITKEGEVLKVEIIEISADYVEYNTVKDNMNTVERINRDNIKEIFKKPKGKQDYSGNTNFEKKIKVPINDFTELNDAHRNNIKMSFTALGQGSLIMGYERILSLRWRSEVLFQAHGLGFSSSKIDKNGVGLEMGVKYKLSAPLENKELFDNYYLHGAYIKGVLGLSSINEKIENDNGQFKFENVNRDYFYTGLDLGYQWVFANRFTMDVFMGLNYFNGNFEQTVEDNGQQIKTELKELEDGDLWGDNNVGVAAGLHVGYLFSIKKKKGK